MLDLHGQICAVLTP